MAEIEGQQALVAAVAEIDRQIENLQKAKQAIVGLLGGNVPPSSPSSSLAPSTPTATVGEPLALVREQEFHGMSIAEAAQVFLRRVGAQKTGTILAALQKGGQESKSKFPESAVYTSLARHLAFVSLKKNWWDLAERRPDLAEEQRALKRRPKTRLKRSRGRAARSRMKPPEHGEDGQREPAVGVADE